MLFLKIKKIIHFYQKENHFLRQKRVEGSSELDSEEKKFELLLSSCIICNIVMERTYFRIIDGETIYENTTRKLAALATARTAMY
jgi:hypothetical protein